MSRNHIFGKVSATAWLALLACLCLNPAITAQALGEVHVPVALQDQVSRQQPEMVADVAIDQVDGSVPNNDEDRLPFDSIAIEDAGARGKVNSLGRILDSEVLQAERRLAGGKKHENAPSEEGGKEKEQAPTDAPESTEPPTETAEPTEPAGESEPTGQPTKQKTAKAPKPAPAGDAEPTEPANESEPTGQPTKQKPTEAPTSAPIDVFGAGGGTPSETERKEEGSQSNSDSEPPASVPTGINGGGHTPDDTTPPPTPAGKEGVDTPSPAPTNATETTTEPPTVNDTTSDNQSAVDSAGGGDSSGDGSGGMVKWIFFLMLFGGGAAYYVKTRMNFGSPPGAGGVGTGGKYRKVATLDKDTSSDNGLDDEWGWDDPNSNSLVAGGGSGQVELPSRSSLDLKQRSFGSQHQQKQNNLWDSSGPATTTSNAPISKLASPKSSAAPSSATKMGLSLGRSAPGHTPSSSLPTAATPAAPPISSFASTTAAWGRGQAVTSFGQIKKAPPKAKPEPQDDIFASMGLAATPTFSHPSSSGSGAAKPAVSKPMGGGRWAAAAATATTTTAAASTMSGMSLKAASGSTTAATSSLAAAAGTADLSTDNTGGDDDDWGDDGDLDDLLDL